ncbi:MAG: hypothetical protein ACI920_001479, partial [Saprospiraceae bacterium]
RRWSVSPLQAARCALMSEVFSIQHTTITE